MAILLKKLFLLLLPFLLLAGYTEFRLAGMDNGYSRKAEGIERWANTSQLLILGSSHALYGIDPAGLQMPAYNLANVSQSYYYDYQIFLKYVKSLTQLRAVVVPVSYFSLDYSLSHTPEQWRRYFYRRYFGLRPEGAGAGTPEKLDARRFSMIALYGVEQSVKFLRKNFRNDLDNLTERGWQRAQVVNSLALTAGRAGERVAFHHSLELVGQDQTNLGYLAALAREAEGAGAQLILITLPVDRSYAGAADPDRYRSMVDRASAFCRIQGCAYLNYFEDPRFNGEDFFDSDHLNSRGAAKFSGILNADLMALMVPGATAGEEL